MGAFDNFLRRRGYAKLDRYGLVLTPDDRVLSTRAGGTIVGWLDGDFVAAPTRASVPAPVPIAAPKPPVVAAEPVVEEDDWEWEIAMARARAAAEDVQSAATSMAFTRPAAPAPRPAAPRTKPIVAVAAPRPAAEPMSAWPKTEELTTQWNDATEASAPRVMSPLEKEIAIQKRSTVIPVPTLPVAARPGDVRPAPQLHARTSSPRARLARGTGREDTVQTQPIASANDDHTSPYVTLPPEVKATGYAHTRRAAAKIR